MGMVTFTVYCCGMSDKSFSDRTMIYKPHRAFCEKFVIDSADKRTTLTDIIRLYKDRVRMIDDAYLKLVIEDISVDRLYIQTPDILWGITKNEYILNMFDYWETNELNLCFFLVGGASIHCEGYFFLVHPNEDIHRFTPHVHVRRDDEETRYRLDTLERFPKDNISKRFLKDEKKIIKPYLRKHQEILLDFWNKYMDGSSSPGVDVRGRQYYRES